MTQTKFAAIHGGLLVRKGAAAPAVSSLQPHQAEHAEQWRNRAHFDGNERRDAEQALPDPIGNRAAEREAQQHAVCCASGESSPSAWADMEAVILSIADHAQENAAARRGISDKGQGRYQITVRLSAEQRRRLITASAQLGVVPARLALRALEAYLDGLTENELQGCACIRRRMETGQEP